MKKSTVILIWGAATGIASVIFYQVLNATGMEDSGIKYFNILILFLGLFFGTVQLRDKANGGYLSYGEGFKTGFLMCLIIAVITTIVTMIDFQIHPEMVDKIREQAQTNMVNKGYTDEQIQMSMKYTEMFTTPTAITILALIFTLFFGTILSLITAGISTKKKPFFEDENTTPGSTPAA